MAQAKQTYDKTKRYALTLTRVVEVAGGLVFRPSLDDLPEVDGVIANEIESTYPGAIQVATELKPLPELPTPPTQTHETAEGEFIVVNPSR